MRALVVFVTLILGAATAVAQDVAIPPPPATTPAPGAAPAPATPAPVHATAPAAAPSTPVTLRIGSTGQVVRDLQNELRRRRIRVTADGAFGPATKRAVRRIQERFKMRATGVADASLLSRLGLRSRLAAAATAPKAATIAPGASPYLSVFPVGGAHSFADDFGAPRHQGRHEGVDIMAERGTPLLAVDNGSIVRMSSSESGLAGISLWLERADGTQYFYAHMNAIAEGLAVGSRVGVGQVIGSVGNTGDARYGAPHLHFELHPGGGDAADPYPHLAAVDPSPPTQSRATP